MRDEIFSAAEFRRLRISEVEAEYGRAAEAPASIEVWKEVIRLYPGMREWVAHNKTVPIEILYILASDPGADVRSMVSSRRKLDRRLFEQLSRDLLPEVRRVIATNMKTPFDIRSGFLLDPERDVLREAHLALSD